MQSATSTHNRSVLQEQISKPVSNASYQILKTKSTMVLDVFVSPMAVFQFGTK